MTRSGATEEGRPLLLLALLCLAVSTTYILSMLSVTDGHFVPQVSDLYLIAQYARGFAEGHPFQFNPGEAPTTGATSLLHTVFLALAHFVGFRGEGLIAFAIFSGAIFSFLTVLEAYDAGRLLSERKRVALLGALLVVLNGPLAWSFHYGADIALVLFLSAWLFRTWIEGADAGPGGSTGWVLPACLLALSRPEALVLVAPLAAWCVFERRQSTGKWSASIWLFLPAVIGLLMPLFMRLITGSAANTSFSQKLLSENWGGFGAAVFSIEYWTDILRGVLLGFYPASERIGLGGGSAPYYAAPFLLVLVFLALLRKSPRLTRAGWFLLAALLTALALTPTIHLGVHFNRYLLFVLPPLLVLSALGTDVAAGLLGTALAVPRERVFRRLAALLCIFGLLSVSRFALQFADSAATIYKKDEAVFEFIRTRLPETATFLANGVSIEYRTGRRSKTLSGVVTPGFALILPVETEASAFEVLSRPESGDLPPYLIAQTPYVEGSPAWAALVRGPAIFLTSSLDGAEFAIYPTRGDLIGRQKSLVRLTPDPAWTPVDSMNVTDPVDEGLHDYRFRSVAGTRSLYGALKIDTYGGEGRGTGTEVADGGRVILGSEEFSLKTPAKGDLWLVMRTHGAPSARVRHPAGESRVDLTMPESVLRLSTARGRTEWFRTSLEPGWNEVLYKIPAELVEPPVTRLRVEGRYAAYSYVAFQAK